MQRASDYDTVVVHVALALCGRVERPDVSRACAGRRSGSEETRDGGRGLPHPGVGHVGSLSGALRHAVSEAVRRSDCVDAGMRHLRAGDMFHGSCCRGQIALAREVRAGSHVTRGAVRCGGRPLAAAPPATVGSPHAGHAVTPTAHGPDPRRRPDRSPVDADRSRVRAGIVRTRRGSRRCVAAR